MNIGQIEKPPAEVASSGRQRGKPMTLLLYHNFQICKPSEVKIMAYPCKIRQSKECDACGSCMPDAPESIYECAICGHGLFNGDHYFSLGGVEYCTGCVEDAEYIAE